MPTDRQASLKWTQRYENAAKTACFLQGSPHAPRTHYVRACAVLGPGGPELRMHVTSRPCLLTI